MANHKIVCYFNMAAHYNSLFYRKIDEHLRPDFVFGEKEGVHQVLFPIKKYRIYGIWNAIADHQSPWYAKGVSSVCIPL